MGVLQVWIRKSSALSSLSAYLGILGGDVRVAFSGNEAIEIAPEFRPQLVVLDINMPGLSGFETIASLKHLGVGARRNLRRPQRGESDPPARRDGRRLSPFPGEGRFCRSPRRHRRSASHR